MAATAGGAFQGGDGAAAVAGAAGELGLAEAAVADHDAGAPAPQEIGDQDVSVAGPWVTALTNSSLTARAASCASTGQA